MSNPWIRLWVEMPHDPKFRIVAKISGQPIALVMATYVYMMCDANNCHGESRGVTKCHDEEIAVTLECDIEQIVKIKDAMQGRLLDVNMLSGWEKRQPKREDIGNPETGAKSAAERKRAQRANAKQDDQNHDVTQCHDGSRNVPLDKIREDKEQPPLSPVPGCVDVVADQNEPQRKRQTGNEGFESFWLSYPKKVGKGAAEAAWKKAGINGHLPDVLTALAIQKNSDQWLKDNGQYIPYPSTWLNQKRWLDGDAAQSQSSVPSWAGGVV
jgi:hypothetical protein